MANSWQFTYIMVGYFKMMPIDLFIYHAGLLGLCVVDAVYGLQGDMKLVGILGLMEPNA